MITVPEKEYKTQRKECSMKKILLSLGIVSLLFGVSGIQASAKDRYSAQTYYQSNMAIVYDAYIDAFNKKFPEKQIKKFYGNELVSFDNMLDAVKSGVLTIGQIVPHIYSKISAGEILTTMPYIAKDSYEGDELLTKYGYDKFAEKIFAESDIKLLGITWGSTYHLVTKKPLKSIDDLKGMKIRALGLSAKIFKKLGVTCVNMPPESLYMALSDNSIDGAVLGSAFEYKQLNLHEVAPWYNTAPVAPLADYLVTSMESWNKFSPEEQQFLLEEAKKVKWLWYKKVEKEEQALRDSIYKGTTYSFSDKDVEKLRMVSRIVLEEEMVNNDNLAEGIEILKKFMDEKK